MTYNEKKRFLEGYIYSVRRIKGLQNQLEEWGTIATNITQKIKPVMVQNGTNSSKIENCAIKIAEIESQLVREIDNAMARKENIEGAISSIKDTRRREIVEMRYIHDMSVKRIANEVGKDSTNIYKMLRKTVKNIDI